MIEVPFPAFEFRSSYSNSGANSLDFWHLGLVKVARNLERVLQATLNTCVADPRTDQATEIAVSQFEKEDPDYATQRGLTVVHFLAEGNPIHNGQWMMISRNWGQQSKNILETSSKLLSPYHWKHITVRLPYSCFVVLSIVRHIVWALC